MDETNQTTAPQDGATIDSGATQVAPSTTPQPNAQEANISVPNVPQEVPNGSIPEDWQAYTTGNAVLDTSIAAVLQTMGSNPEEFANGIEKAIKYNDPSLIDGAMLAKYKQYAPMIKSFTEAIIAQENANQSTLVNTAYSLAGSKENWDQAVQMFNANAPDYLRETVKFMIDNGNSEAGMRMLLDSVRGYGTMPNNVPPYQGTPTGSRGLSFDEMKSELAKLTKEAGGASLESGTYGRRYEDIMARRKLGREQGL